MGVAAERSQAQPDVVTIDAGRVTTPEAPYDLVKTMRASILVLGRCWRASARRPCRCPAAAPSARGRSTSTSRACARWARHHRRARLHRRQGEPRLKGASITTDMITVTGTENC
jgi:UDP-N-acetylglucosamine 1-carboxyvinyltransferase